MSVLLRRRSKDPATCCKVERTYGGTTEYGLDRAAETKRNGEQGMKLVVVLLDAEERDVIIWAVGEI